MPEHPRSVRAFRRAQRVLVGGVDSPVRAFAGVGGTPLFFSRGKGAYLYDLDGARYLDLVGSWGANLLGHAPPAVVRAVRRVSPRGLSFGAPSPLEHELGERLQRAIPGLGLLRFVNSGTEAVMSAVRAARGFTGRTRIVKFAGGYHGHSDGLLVRAGSGVAAGGRPGSAGVPASFARETLVLPYNDPAAVRLAFERAGESLAAVVVEPIAANMGLVLPKPGFLREIERSCRKHGALWIADEVITGFRLTKGVVHPRYGVHADLVTLGKIIGGGLPVGAYGGREEVMSQVAPLGPVYQAGTLAGNPVAMAAGAATLDELDSPLYLRLERIGRELESALREEAAAAGVPDLRMAREGSMLGLFFGGAYPTNLEEAEKGDRERYARFFWGALGSGIYLPPARLETAFASAAMGELELTRARRGFARAFRALAGGQGARR